MPTSANVLTRGGKNESEATDAAEGETVVDAELKTPPELLTAAGDAVHSGVAVDDADAVTPSESANDAKDDRSKPAAEIDTAALKPEPMEGVEEVSKCSCLKSKCLKLYCECLREGIHCSDDCVCKDCHNLPAHDGEGGIRLDAIRWIIAKKPDALTEEMRAMAYEGGWEPPAKPQQMKSPFVKSNGYGKTKKKGGKKRMPVRSSAGKTIAKGKNARSDNIAFKRSESDYDYDDNYEDESYSEEFATSEDAIPYTLEEFPQLALDPKQDHSSLASAFVKPLFDEPKSRALAIAYTHRQAVAEERRRAQRKKNAILNEYNILREKLQKTKLVLSLADDKVKQCNKKAGAWTRKVFDLELEEPCTWNENYRRLKQYKEVHGRLPISAKKATDEEEKSLATWVDRIRCQKNLEAREEEEETTPTGRKKRNKNKTFIRDYPHRLECLANLGVTWESHHGNKWETMFQKLLVYKEEMGTLRFPTDDQCAATGNEELIALQKWVKGQVLMFRYGKKKNPEVIKRLQDIGFDFEKWYAKPGKSKKSKEEDGNNNNNEEDEVDGAVAKMEEISEEGQQLQQQQPVQEVLIDNTMMMDTKMPANEEGGEAVRVQYAI